MDIIHQQIVAYSPLVAGAAGIPVIQQLVEFLKDQFRIPTYFAPILSIVLGILINVALGAYLKQPLGTEVTIGLAAGLGASGWHAVNH